MILKNLESALISSFAVNTDCKAVTTTCLCAFLPMNGEPSALLPAALIQIGPMFVPLTMYEVLYSFTL